MTDTPDPTPIDVTCPRAACGDSDVVIVWDAQYRIGQADPVDYIAKGAKCRTCRTYFWNDQTAAALADLNYDPPDPETDAQAHR